MRGESHDRSLQKVPSFYTAGENKDYESRVARKRMRLP